VYGTAVTKKGSKNSVPGESVLSFVSNNGVELSKLEPEVESAANQQNLISRKDSSSLKSASREIVRRESQAPLLEPYRNPSNYTWIPDRYRGLIGYFTEKMTRSISCYDVVQKQYCSTLLPMATTSPHLLAAVLYLAACHRTSRGLKQNPVETDHLRTSSLRQLRLSIAAPGAQTDLEAAIASTLTLCIADIVSEVAQPGSWRIHLEGALMLYSQLIKDPSYTAKKETTSMKFLKRWYISFETIAFSCGIIPARGYMSQVEADAPVDLQGRSDYIDDIWSFSTLLLPVFEEINILKANLQGQASPVSQLKFEGDSDEIQDTCQILISSVNEMLKNRRLKFRADVEKEIPHEVKLQYFKLDEAYHHMALLQIYTCSRRRISAETVRHSVCKVIASSASMTFLDNACPAVAILPPLFIAGSQAWDKGDQQNILMILDRMEACWGMGNVRTSRNLLTKIWLAQAERKDEMGPFQWERATGMLHSELFTRIMLINIQGKFGIFFHIEEQYKETDSQMG
jgi:hypothetical protein